MSKQMQSSTALSTENLRALLAERLRKAASQSQSIPLSCAQHRLWFLDQLEPNSPLYNIPSIARLSGNLDVPALEQALNAIIARHESLRTRFISMDGEPRELIDPSPATPGTNKYEMLTNNPAEATAKFLQIQQEDLTVFEPKEREAEVERRIRAELQRPFNLSKDRLVRATLLRLRADEHVFILTMHHIISDEWSFKIFFGELEEFYRGQIEGRPVSLPELPIQYADYAIWQREWLKSSDYQKQLSYWKEQMRGDPPALELPTDHPRRPRPSSAGAVLTRELAMELRSGLKSLADEQNTTLFMVLLAAFKTLVFRYTQQTDVVVGSPLAGRNRMETENLIGFFVNTLPLRTRLSGEMTFLELLRQVREVALAAYSHQELPFEKLVEAMQPERSLNQTPFINALFLIQNSTEEMRLPGVTIEFIDRGTETAKFDLTMGVQETPYGLLAGIEYRTELFEAATIARWLQHYEWLLRSIAAEPTKRLSEFTLLTPSERLEFDARCNSPSPNRAGPEKTAAGREAGKPPTLQQWFESQVERTPDAIAVTCEGQNLSYRQLNDQANQLAHYLKKLGVGPDMPVALHLERSLTMLVAILGAVKAGGAYVPMDAASPQERLMFMIEDTNAPVILTMENARRNLPNIAGRQVICLDADWEQIAGESKENPPAVNRQENTAYIIYTSGSTGQPKGVLVTHGNVVRLFEQTEHWYHFDSNDVWTLFHSYTFDFSVWEMWGALLYGGRLVVVPYMTSRSPADFYKLLAEEKVTILNQTPSAFRQLLWAEATAPAQLPLSLRYVIFGGEALELQSLKPWFDRHGDQTPLLVNMYGITETTVHVTYRPIRIDDLRSGVGSVIGVPIPDLRIYLLDEHLQPAPVGVPGEICVGGAGVAKGYLNRAELTAQRFIDDPFSHSGGKLYRSGDLARYTTGGDLEYLGRMDHQVKIRGFRVELGEIESTLNRHSAIRESVVLAAPAPGGQRLVAYVVPRGNSGLASADLDEIRQFLSRTLPDYMLPSNLLVLPALPLTGNGKVDRRALPSPDSDQAGAREASIPPRNATESALAGIWCELLDRKSVGVGDNFFQLGGHSLLATQVIWRIAETLKVELPVRTIFEAPTVAALAEAVSRAQPSGTSSITRRARESNPDDLLERLEQLSEADLQRLLQYSKVRAAST